MCRKEFDLYKRSSELGRMSEDIASWTIVLLPSIDSIDLGWNWSFEGFEFWCRTINIKLLWTHLFIPYKITFNGQCMIGNSFVNESYNVLWPLMTMYL